MDFALALLNLLWHSRIYVEINNKRNEYKTMLHMPNTTVARTPRARGWWYLPKPFPNDNSERLYTDSMFAVKSKDLKMPSNPINAPENAPSPWMPIPYCDCPIFPQ